MRYSGTGPQAEQGKIVTYNPRLFLRRGDEVTQDRQIISRALEHLTTRNIDGDELIDHVAVLGRRHAIAGVEKSLLGMRENGYREVLVSSHLAFGDKGIANLIAPKAMLRIRLWVWNVAESA